jgi:hypothetical protein
MSTDVGGVLRSYLWDAGNIIEIGAGMEGRVEVFDMNQAGDCVGSGDHGAILFHEGQTYDLNDLIENASDVPLFRGAAINDLGQILALRWDEGLVLLSPVPSAASGLVLPLGLGCLGRRSRRAAIAEKSRA